MNITIAVPEGKNCKKRIQQELATSRNIKLRGTRVSVETGLRKILEKYQEGKAYLWNGSELSIYDYPLKDFIYHCGKDFACPEIPRKNSYLLITMDAKEATMGILNGKQIIPIVNKQSVVPGKVNGGGQSKERYARERTHKLIVWMKELADKAKDIAYNKG